MKKGMHHSVEFKREAVALARGSEASVAEIAADLGISSRTLHRWLQEGQAGGGRADAGGSDEAGLGGEVKRLRRELEVVRQERDILKKAISVFSRERG